MGWRFASNTALSPFSFSMDNFRALQKRIFDELFTQTHPAEHCQPTEQPAEERPSWLSFQKFVHPLGMGALARSSSRGVPNIVQHSRSLFSSQGTCGMRALSRCRWLDSWIWHSAVFLPALQDIVQVVVV